MKKLILESRVGAFWLDLDVCTSRPSHFAPTRDPKMRFFIPYHTEKPKFEKSKNKLPRGGIFVFLPRFLFLRSVMDIKLQCGYYATNICTDIQTRGFFHVFAFFAFFAFFAVFAFFAFLHF